MTYRSVCLELCEHYSKVSMFNKLEQHCKFLLNQGIEYSHLWRYLGDAYRYKGLTISAEFVEKIYYTLQKLKKKQYKRAKTRRFFYRPKCRYHPSKPSRAKKRTQKKTQRLEIEKMKNNLN